MLLLEVTQDFATRRFTWIDDADIPGVLCELPSDVIDLPAAAESAAENQSKKVFTSLKK